MVKRLTREGLRRLVVAEVRRLDEAGDDSDFYSAMNDANNVDDIVEKMVELFRVGNPYNPDDPVMSETGEAEWDDQVEAACDELSDKLWELVPQISHKLLNGEYYKGG